MNNSNAHTQLVHDTWALLGQVKGLICWKTNSSVHDENFRRALPVGWPDLFVLFDGGTCAFLEAKTGSARQNENQAAFGALVARHHGHYHVFRGPQQALDICIGLMGGKVEMTDGRKTWVEGR